MSLFPTEAQPDPFEVVIAGGGVAALETVLALHALAPGRTRTRLVAPNREFVNPALSVAAPFGTADQPRWKVADVARDNGAVAIVDTIVAVDPDGRAAETASGERLPYDALVLTMGARRTVALEGALTFTGPRDVEAFRRLLQEAESGELDSIAFAVPRGSAWTLPAYELALMTATHLAARRVRGTQITIATPERTPLGIFGRRTSDAVAALLRDAGIALVTVPPERVAPGTLVLADGGEIEADRVVALPRLEAPEIAGIPRASDGFIPTDLHGRVDGLEGVYAAGDATWYPVKQGGIASQQADVVAAAIAASAGAAVVARRFRPVLRGALLTGEGVEYLRDGGPSDAAPWWPPAKIAGRYLGPFLAGEAASSSLETVAPAHVGAEMETLAMALDAADAGWGDYGSALRWLSVAERLGVALPESYAVKREAWRDALSVPSITH